MANNYQRPIITAGNDFYINITLSELVDGDIENFDLSKCKSVEVYLICATHNTKINLDFEIIDVPDHNIIKAFVDHRMLHNTSYGIGVEGDYEDDLHWRWFVLPKEGMLIIPNTSGQNIPTEVEYIDLAGRVGFGVDLSDYYTKEQTDDLLDDKQDVLVSGENIKTINNESILGAGNIDIQFTQEQADWNQTDNTQVDYIKNKPTIPAAQIQSDWNQTNTSSADYIKNKPTIQQPGFNQVTNSSDNTKVGLVNSLSTNYGTNIGNGAIIEGVGDEGQQDIQATGTFSHAEGFATIASGGFSHAEGSYTQATNWTAHAEGYLTVANGNDSHAEGWGATANGAQSHAEGRETTANGDYSHAEGYQTGARNESEHATGQHNWSHTVENSSWGDGGNTLFSVGNGAVIDNDPYTIQMHNAFEVRQNGDIYIADTNDTSTQNYYEKPTIKLQDVLDGKQEELVSGTNIKTINNQSILGAGDITIIGQTGPTGPQGPTGPTGATGPAGTTDYNDLTNKPDLSIYATTSDLATKQDLLVSGTNIKTINNQSILGAGNLVIESGDKPYEEQYLTFEAIQSGTFTFSTNDLQYSLDNGATWTTLTAGTASPTVTAGDKILWKQTGLTPVSNAGIGKFSATGNFKAYGNIMSLYYGDNFIGQTSLSGKDYAFASLFGNNTKLVNAENLILPATTLSYYCYRYMFDHCSSLTTAPELPATTLSSYCYYCMFSDCTSLTTAPELPATTLSSYCYSGMFKNCTSLTIAPELHATTLERNCYSSMFQNCTSLTIAPELPATTLAHYCYQGMFQQCTALTKAPELPATTLIGNCYQQMFFNCSSLNYIKCLATNISASNCTTNWVNNVAATGTFVTANNAPAWTIDASGIPTGWNAYTESQYELVHRYELPAAPVQSNWNESDSTSLAYIQNKPNVSEPGFVKLVNGNNTGLVNSLSTNYDTNIGDGAVIEGNGYSTVLKIVASGSYSHAEGNGTKSSGAQSHAEGFLSTASGNTSHAEGNATIASGAQSHAEGSSTESRGQHSHAEGYRTITNNKYEHAEGTLNKSTQTNNSEGDAGNTLSSIGNGVYITGTGFLYHNAFEVRQNGDIYYSDTEKIDGTTVHYYDVPMRKLQDAMVTSTTNGMKIDVVSALPANPDTNTIYIIA